MRAAIQVVAREAFGAQLVERLIPGFSSSHRNVEPLAGVWAAVLARDVATRCVREYALAARADGQSWDAIAEALGLEQAHGLVGRGERAYLHVVEDRPLHTEDPDHCWGRSAPGGHWRCTTCDRYVTDHGPFEAAPYNAEDGHLPACARHTREIAAYKAEWGEQ